MAYKQRQQHEEIEPYIYGVNLDSLRTKGHLRVKLLQANGVQRSRVITIGRVGSYDVALKLAQETRDEFFAADLKLRRAIAAESIPPPRVYGIKAQSAKADVDAVIARFGWKPVDDYFGSHKLTLPFHLL